MSVQTTLAMIKPDAVANGLAGEIIRRAQAGSLTPVGLKMLRLTRDQAEAFYGVHRGRPFFDELVEFMTEGPIVAMALRGEGAIARWREVMGATDPAEAAEGTIRRDLGESKGRNATHGSDAEDTAAAELRFFFSELELV